MADLNRTIIEGEHHFSVAFHQNQVIQYFHRGSLMRTILKMNSIKPVESNFEKK